MVKRTVLEKLCVKEVYFLFFASLENLYVWFSLNLFDRRIMLLSPKGDVKKSKNPLRR